MTTWVERLQGLSERLGRKPPLEEMLVLSRDHKMTAEELEAQRQSWVRANAPTGDVRLD